MNEYEESILPDGSAILKEKPIAKQNIKANRFINANGEYATCMGDILGVSMRDYLKGEAMTLLRGKVNACYGVGENA